MVILVETGGGGLSGVALAEGELGLEVSVELDLLHQHRHQRHLVEVLHDVELLLGGGRPNSSDRAQRPVCTGEHLRHGAGREAIVHSHDGVRRDTEEGGPDEVEQRYGRSLHASDYEVAEDRRRKEFTVAGLYILSDVHEKIAEGALGLDAIFRDDGCRAQDDADKRKTHALEPLSHRWEEWVIEVLVHERCRAVVLHTGCHQAIMLVVAKITSEKALSEADRGGQPVSATESPAVWRDNRGPAMGIM